MRMLLKVALPTAKFNAAVKDGTVGVKMQKIMAEQKPEAAYFVEMAGIRTGILVVNLTDASQIPSFAEPWFLQFEASVEMHPAMTVEDLAKGDLAGLGKKWG